MRRVKYPEFCFIILALLVAISSSQAHVVDTDVVSTGSAASGTLSGSTDWRPLMSDTIKTEGGDVFFDFQTTTYGCSHNTWAIRLKVDGEDETVIRQGDSDASNQKMHDLFDVVNLSEGEHSVDVEWKLYAGHTWRVDSSGSNYDCGEERGSDLQLQEDAVLNIMEFDKNVDWSINDTREGTTEGDGEWKTLLTTSEKIEENNVAIFRGFTSAFHPYAYDDTHGYQTRLLVEGNEVSRSSTSESNVFFNIASLLSSKRYSSDKTVEVKLQWRGDSRVASSGYDEYILGENAQSYDSSFPDENGSHARLGVIEFEAPVDYASSSTDSGSAPSSWNTLEGVDLSTDNSFLFTQAHVSASVSNDNDYFMRTLVDGQEKARQSTGVSDPSAQDNMFLSTVESVGSGTFDIESQWQTEGSTDWEDSELVALGLKNSTFDIKFCDRRGELNECISENEHDLGAASYTVSSIFRSLNTSYFVSSGGKATVNVTNSSEISGTWEGAFSILSEPKPLIKPGAEFRPDGGNIVIGE